MVRKFSYAVAFAFAAVICFSAATATAQNSDAYQAIVKCEFGTAISERAAIEKIIQDAKPADYPAIEAKLIGIIADDKATMAGKQFALRMLKSIASDKCVPAVSKLLTDKELSHTARNVLYTIGSSKADSALRDALETVKGPARTGIINTIGDRQDTAALNPLVKMLKNADADTAPAILNAIGKIGGTIAADALDKTKPSEALKPAWAMAYLRCAQSVAEQGKDKKAQAMYKSLLEGAYPGAVRAGALNMIVLSQKEAAVPMVMQLLASEDELIRRTAMSAVQEIPGRAATEAFIKQLDKANPAMKSLLIGMLAARGDSAATIPAVNKLVSDPDTGVRKSAIRALRGIGDASSIPVLAGILNDRELGEEAKLALANLKGKEVSEALIKLAETGEPAVRINIMNLLADRKDTAALPLARKALTDSSIELRKSGLKVIAKTGEQADIGLLCSTLLAEKDAAQQELIAQTASAVGKRSQDKNTRCDAIVDCFTKANAQTKVLLLQVLSSLGGDKALETLRKALSEQGDVHKAAVRAMTEWADASPISDLRKAANEESDAATKILALRGFISMITKSNMNNDEKVMSYAAAMQIAARAEEKSLILAGVSDIAHPESLKVIAFCLGDEKLKGEAFIAYAKTAEALIASQPAAAKDALQKVISETTDEGLRNKASEAIKKIK